MLSPFLDEGDHFRARGWLEWPVSNSLGNSAFIPVPWWRTQPRVCTSPHGGCVAQQANQSILRDGCVMQAERFLLQLLSEELEGLWGCNAEQTRRSTSLEKDEV